MEQPLLQCQGVAKSFYKTRVLSDVSFALRTGQVLGLVGENGAGKSTLINILGGVLQADQGELTLDGAPYAPASPADAATAGIAVVHQELNLFSNLSVAENLLLSDLPRRRRLGASLIDRRELHRQAQEILSAIGLELDPHTRVAALSPGERQLVEIARAVHGKPRVVVFDEPTTSLGEREAQRVFEVIDRLRQHGTGIVYISHNLGDVLRLCDEVLVLRDGQVQLTSSASDVAVEQLISAMVGRSLQSLFPPRTASPLAETLLEVRDLSQTGVVERINFELHRGEILGISGLMGSGRTELARILFGLDSYQRGRILVHGRPLERATPGRCIERGMAFLTEDRRHEGLLAEANLEDNVALVALDRHASGLFGRIRGQSLHSRVEQLTQTLGVQCTSLRRQAVRTLSGGNQQKIVLAKWLMSGADILILDEPTRGVDVGAKYDIYAQIIKQVEAGAGVLMISSELEELVGLCDRILVMSQGEIQSTVDSGQFNRDALLRAALGENRLQ